MLLHALERCPVCDHALRHTGAAGACPACGFAYDESTRVWRSSQTWSGLAAGYTAAGLIVGLLVALADRARPDTLGQPILPLTLALATPLVALALRRWIFGRLTGRFVALDSAGVVIGTRTVAEFVAWEDVVGFVEQRGVVKLRRRSTETLIALDDIFDTRDEAADFRARAQSRARAARPPA